jgi:hypothetical protein
MGKWIEKIVLKEETQMANKYLKKHQTLLTTKEIQIKTTLRFCLTIVGMAIVKKTKTKSQWGCGKKWARWGCGEKWALLHFYWEYKLHITMKVNMEVPENIKNKTTSWPLYGSFEHISKGAWVNLHLRHLHTHIYCHTIHKSQAMESA